MESLTVLVPAYNEEKLIRGTVLGLLKYLQKLNVDFEIIICINASTDNTEKIAKMLSKSYKNIRYFSIKKKGFGIALIEGIKAANKDLITYMPSDDEIKHDFIKMALKEIKNYDMILGSRYLPTSSQSKADVFRLFLSKAYARIVKILLSFKVNEFGTVKMFEANWAKKTVRKCTSSHWDFQIEMLYFALREKQRIKEIPVKINYQRERESTVNIIRDIISLFKCVTKYSIKLRFNQLFKG